MFFITFLKYSKHNYQLDYLEILNIPSVSMESPKTATKLKVIENSSPVISSSLISLVIYENLHVLLRSCLKGQFDLWCWDYFRYLSSTSGHWG